MHRGDVNFSVEGVRCAAWLYRPDGPPPHAAVVMAHGFGATRRIRLDAYAERFAAAGFAVFVFDYRHFGDSEGFPRQLLDIGRQLADWTEAVRVARALPDVDPTRVAIWGTSFSGGHVLALAAGDSKIAACIAQVPFVDGLANARWTPLEQSGRLALCAARDLLRGWTRREPFRIPIIGPPGTLAAITSPDADIAYRTITAEGIEWKNEVAARIFLFVPGYRPGLRAGLIRCPVLFCLADRDSVTPVAPALAAAARAPRAEVKRYPLEHFAVYLNEGFERTVGDQIAFLRRHLTGAGP